MQGVQLLLQEDENACCLVRHAGRLGTLAQGAQHLTGPKPKEIIVETFRIKYLKDRKPTS